MFNEGRAVHFSRKLFLVLLVLSVSAVLISIGALFSLTPPTSAAIAVLWLMIVPLSYQVLAEGGVASRTMDLPGIPTGLTWESSPRRARPKPALPARERALKQMRRALRKLGYSQAPAGDPSADLLAESPEGKSFVIKVVEGQAGVLACQDAMKAMIGSGAREAILLAPEGSTSTARRFVRKIRSRKGLRIRIWNSAKEGMRS